MKHESCVTGGGRHSVELTVRCGGNLRAAPVACTSLPALAVAAGEGRGG